MAVCIHFWLLVQLFSNKYHCIDTYIPDKAQMMENGENRLDTDKKAMEILWWQVIDTKDPKVWGFESKHSGEPIKRHFCAQMGFQF